MQEDVVGQDVALLAGVAVLHTLDVKVAGTAVQQGMKSAGFSGPKPNPYMERSTANLHRNLAAYMGTGAPHELKDTQ